MHECSVKRTVTVGSAKQASTAAAKQKKAGIDNVLAAIDGPKTISTVRSNSVHLYMIESIYENILLLHYLVWLIYIALKPPGNNVT